MERLLRDNPDITDHWLVYADWLTEQGDARGTLIVREYQMKDPSISERRRRALREEIADIAQSHRERWLPRWISPDDCQMSWRHGFVLKASCSGDPALLLMIDLLEQRTARFLTQLSISNGSEEVVRELCAVLPRSAVHALHLEAARIDIGAILEAGDWRNIRSLGFGPLVRATFDAPATRPPPGPGVLVLDDNHVGDTGALVLTTAQLPDGLEVLNLSNNHIGDIGARAIAKAPWLARLRLLDLSHNRIGPQGASALEAVSGSTEIVLAGNRIAAVAARRLG